MLEQLILAFLVLTQLILPPQTASNRIKPHQTASNVGTFALLAVDVVEEFVGLYRGINTQYSLFLGPEPIQSINSPSYFRRSIGKLTVIFHTWIPCYTSSMAQSFLALDDTARIKYDFGRYVSSLESTRINKRCTSIDQSLVEAITVSGNPLLVSIPYHEFMQKHIFLPSGRKPLH
jgi:hypothetical protein